MACTNVTEFIDEIETSVILQQYADRILVLITQRGKVGSLVRSRPRSVKPTSLSRFKNFEDSSIDTCSNNFFIEQLVSNTRFRFNYFRSPPAATCIDQTNTALRFRAIFSSPYIIQPLRLPCRNTLLAFIPVQRYEVCHHRDSSQTYWICVG
jgi:hypothetical protein